MSKSIYFTNGTWTEMQIICDFYESSETSSQSTYFKVMHKTWNYEALTVMFDISGAKCHLNRCISYCRTSCSATVLLFIYLFLCITPAHLYRSLSNWFTVYRFILSAGVTELSEKCMWPYGKTLSAVLQTFRLSHKRSIILAQTLRFLLGSWSRDENN